MCGIICRVGNSEANKILSEGIKRPECRWHNSLRVIFFTNGKIYLIKNNLHEEAYAFLEDVFADENCRGKGIRTEVIKKAIEIVKKLNCYKIITTSRFEGENIHEWYQKLGFKKFGYEFRMDLK